MLGVTGGIAAYKSAELTRLFVKEGFEVKVIMTKGACEFVTPLTFETLSGNEVSVEMFPRNKHFATHHIDLADWAELLIVAPATANFIGKTASGICDDLLTTVFSASSCPVLIAPAMNSNMWDYPAVVKNVELLQSFGFYFIGPDSGDLACGWVGKGRMVEPAAILDGALKIFSIAGSLKGKKVVVTAGRTEEPIDAVRYISNRSSGKMGYAIAIEARAEGADVTLITGPTMLPEPRGINLVKVRTASQMAGAVKEHFAGCHLLLMSAAVADYTPANPEEGKGKKSDSDISIKLKPTEDILKSVGRLKNSQVVVGFALETDNAIANASRKIGGKNLDFVVLNNPNEKGAGFDTDTNRVDIIWPDGTINQLPLMPKRQLAIEILQRAIRLVRD